MFLTAKKVIKAIFSIILVVICSSNYSAQNNTVPVELKLQEQLKPNIKSGETHNYQIKLQKGETAKINLIRTNIDFSTSIFDSDQNLIIEIDGKGSRYWKQSLTIISTKDSVFSINVKALETIDSIGNYLIEFVEKRNTLPIDEKSQIAEKKLSEAQKLTTNRASLNQAIEKFNEVITLSKELNNKNLESVALVNLAMIFQGLAKYEESINVFKSSLDILKEQKDKQGEAFALHSLAMIYSTLSQYEKAIAYFEQTITVAKEIKNLSLEIIVNNNVGNIYYNIGQKDKAITYFQNSLGLNPKESKDASNKESEANSFNGLGNVYNSIGQYEKAKEFYEKALNINREIKDYRGEGISLSNIGNVYYLLFQFDKALEYYEKSVVIRRKIKDKRGEGNTLNRLGYVYKASNQYEKSYLYFEMALVINKEVKNKVGEISSLEGLCNLFMDLSKYEKAVNYCEQSLIIAKEIKASNSLPSLLNTLAFIQKDLGQNKKAIDYFQQALTIAQQTIDKRAEMYIVNNLGLMYARENQNEKAFDYYNKAFNIGKEINNPLGEASVFNNKGNIYKKTREFDKAKEFYEKSLAIYQKIKAKDYIGTQLVSLGELYLAINQPEKSNSYFGNALIIAREINKPQLEIESLTRLMTLWQKNKQPSLAIFYGKQSVNILQQIRADIKGLDKSLQDSFIKSKEDIYRQLADLLISQGRFKEAQQVLEMLKETEYFEFIRRDKTEIEKLSKRADLTDKEKTALENYLKLADKITLLGQELQTLEDKQSKLPPNQNLSEAEKNRIIELKGLLKIAEDAFQLFLEKDLVAQLSSENIKGLEFDKSLQNELKNFGKGTVSIYTVVTNERYRAIVTTPFSQTDGKTEINLTELNKKIFTFRSALTDPKSDPKILAKELYDILIKPIEKDLEGAKAKTIIWSLDGTLRYIPISALWDGKQYLLEKYQNIVLTSSTKTNIRQQNKADWNILAGGVSDAQEVKPPLSDEKIKFSSLPQVKNELQSIVLDNVSNSTSSKKGLLQGKVLLDNDFTPQSLTTSIQEKQGIGTRKYNLIHLASHFWLGNNTTDSFLLLGNGKYVTLEEIKKSPEFDLTNVELVTLSACNTGFNGGTGAEVDSLATLLESRGAKATLSSLWAVADESTSNLMVEFYRARKNNPKINKGEALRQAQIKLLKDKTGKFSHPFYWSPFVMVGNWR
jgi:CHAT domain-containing protein/Tfp pilus assembly protein PilF